MSKCASSLKPLSRHNIPYLLKHSHCNAISSKFQFLVIGSTAGQLLLHKKYEDTPQLLAKVLYFSEDAVL